MENKECKTCKHSYSLKKDGRYCPKCGRDYWDGLCGGPKILSKEELRLNNDKFKKMKKTTIVLMFMMLFSNIEAQVYWDEILEADTSGYILMSESDGIFDTIPLLFEIRNDSICLVDGDCLGYIPVGLESFSIGYNTTTKGFDISSVTNGVPLSYFIPYYSTHNKLTLSQPLVTVEEVSNEPWETESYTTKIFRYDNPIESESINDSINRIRIGTQDWTGFTTVLHDSIDININDLDSDPTNEIQDTAEIVGLQEFVEDYSINSYTETDPIYSAWDKSYLDLIDTPTIPTNNNELTNGAGYITSYTETQTLQTVTDLGATTTNDINIDGKLSLNDGTKNVLIEGGTSNSGSENVSIGFNAGKYAASGQNTIIGVQAAQSVMSGTGANTYIGYRAALASSTGYENVAIGKNSLYNNASGYRTVAIGSQSGQNLADDNQNVAIGYQSMYNGNGNSNLALGSRSGYSINGSSNIAIGNDAGQLMGAGSNNTFLGANSGKSSTGSYNLFLGNQSGSSAIGSNLLHIHSSNAYTSIPLIYGEFDNRIVEINGDFESTGKVTVGDNIEGNAVNISGYDSENDLTRVSIGTGLSLSSGTLSATGEIQSLGSARMNDITYLTTDYPSYSNISIATENLDNGDVAVNTGFERIEIDSDGGGYYMVTVQGRINCDAGTDQVIEFFTNTASYEYIGTVYVKDTDNQSFHISFPLLFGNSTNIILSVKAPSSPGEDINIAGIDWTITKI